MAVRVTYLSNFPLSPP
ncbi:hypothetical protein Goklo_025215 [Gossypium klotzschianum]|uniref:Uncharacterized protein n=1 Tax=Gossypium klotzschianum TaxID=34286 RepID=A0A7J8W5Q9_9ROSI|nr:hypothetical protein [Gossypium klotzschianum]